MKNRFFLLAFFFSCAKLFSQDLTLYTMDAGAYSNYLRPSVMPEKKYFLAIPLFSSLNFQTDNSSFTYNDLYKKRADDSVYIDMDAVISKLNDNNYIGFNISNIIFEFGMWIKKSYVDFTINERFDFGFVFPKELIELIDKGNGPYIGQSLEFQNLSFDVVHYREYGFGYARNLSKKLSAGIKIKYLYGMENVSTVNKNLTFVTDPEDYSLHLTSDVIVNTSTYFNSKNGYDDMTTGKYIFGLDNRGIAFDVGGTYKANDKLEFNGSVLDLGYIRWNENVKNFRTSEGSYEFNGIDLHQFLGDSTGNIQSIIDSLGEAYKPQETSDPYSTSLHSRVFLSGSYKLRESTKASALINFQFFNGIISPAYSLSAGQKIGKKLSLSLSYSYVNRSYDNLGLGIVFQTKHVNMFFATNNIFGTIFPMSFHTAGFRGGVAFNWGKV